MRAVHLDADGRDLMRVGRVLQMVPGGLIDEVAPAALEDRRAVVSGPILVPHRVPEFVVTSIHRPAVVVQLLPDRLPCGQPGEVLVVHGCSDPRHNVGGSHGLRPADGVVARPLLPTDKSMASPYHVIPWVMSGTFHSIGSQSGSKIWYPPE